MGFFGDFGVANINGFSTVLVAPRNRKDQGTAIPFKSRMVS